tara:strand:+ start:4398 stop:4847 length:450 start_codon:yes stop_codon:yes gene_type:complete
MPYEAGNIGSAIFNILTNNSDVTNIYNQDIGPSNNIYDTMDFPRIVYTVTDLEPSNTKGSNGASTLDVLRVQLACFNLEYTKLIQGMSAVRQALDYINSGSYPSSGEYIVNLQSCSLVSMNQEFIEDFGENGVFVGYLEFQFRQFIGQE